MSKRFIKAVLFFYTAVSPLFIQADVYKCVTSNGQTSYSENRCDTGFVKKKGQWLSVKQHEKREREEVLRIEKLEIENKRIEKLRIEQLRIEQLQAKKQRNDSSGSKNDVSYADTVWLGKTAVKSLLKNPETAEFRSIEYVKFKTGGFICGEVKSKNSFGGYSGWQHFISAGSQNTYLEEQVQGFKGIWLDYCVGKPW